MGTKYLKHINEIYKSLKDSNYDVPTHKIVEELDENWYNYDGRRYEGRYDIANGLLILFVTEKHRGKRYNGWEKVPVVFAVSERTKVVISDNHKPMLVNVLLVE